MSKRGMSKQKRTIAKQWLVLLGSIVLTPILGCLLSAYWAEGGNTFWKSINYFPLPVESILLMKPFGDEFWVRADDNKIYHMMYPCENDQQCWNQTDVVPEINLFDIDYKVTENACENDSIAYPLLRKIRSCVTSIVPNESPWIVSLAVTEDQRLWIWQKPWESPYNVLAGMVGVLVVSPFIGLFLGLFWAWRIR
jgi:hypothetical protein